MRRRDGARDASRGGDERRARVRGPVAKPNRLRRRRGGGGVDSSDPVARVSQPRAKRLGRRRVRDDRRGVGDGRDAQGTGPVRDARGTEGGEGDGERASRQRDARTSLPRWKSARRGGMRVDPRRGEIGGEPNASVDARVSVRVRGGGHRARDSVAGRSRGFGGEGEEEEKTEKTAAEEGQKSGAAPAAAPAVQVRQARRRRRRFRYRRRRRFGSERGRVRPVATGRTLRVGPRRRGMPRGGGASLPTRGRRRPGRPTRREHPPEWQNDERGSNRARVARDHARAGGIGAGLRHRRGRGSGGGDDDAGRRRLRRRRASRRRRARVDAARTTRNDSDALSRRVFHVRAGGEARSRDGRRKRTRGGGGGNAPENRVRGGRGG